LKTYSVSIFRSFKYKIGPEYKTSLNMLNSYYENLNYILNDTVKKLLGNNY